jgi:hypothetical protein
MKNKGTDNNPGLKPFSWLVCFMGLKPHAPTKDNSNGKSKGEIQGSLHCATASVEMTLFLGGR